MKTLRTTVANFLRHSGTDLAAGLTYYSVLAIFPALLALVAMLSVVGEAGSSVNVILDVLRPLVSASTLADIEPTIRDLAQVNGAGWALAAGAVVALYSSSAYVAAFGRAMNRVHDVTETRPWWRLRPLMLAITVAVVLLMAASLVIVVATGPLASSLGDQLGLADSAVRAWSIAKWPVLAVMVVIVVTLLFHATPNVKFGFRLLTWGAFLTLLVWISASVGFAFYLANFASYNKTYGSVAGVVVGLLWLWLTNLSLVFGAEFDAVRQQLRKERAAAAAGEDGVAAEIREVPALPLPEGPVYGPMPQPVPEED